VSGGAGSGAGDDEEDSGSSDGEGQNKQYTRERTAEQIAADTAAVRGMHEMALVMEFL
jgi:hypothetical protein